MNMNSASAGGQDMISSMMEMISSTLEQSMMTMIMSSSLPSSSTTMSAPTSMLMSTSSSIETGPMSMSMPSSMSMPISSSSGLVAPSVYMAGHPSSTMIMSTSTGGNSNMTATMNEGSMNSEMNMNMDMEMNSYLTSKYKNYPVLFQKLYADTRGKAFGIFLLVVVASFVYKALLFVSWCLEVHWFKKWDASGKHTSIKNATENTRDEERDTEYFVENGLEMKPLPKLPNLLTDFMVTSYTDLLHDFIRAILIFCSTMIIYMLMLVAMSFILTYVFAVILGLTLAEVFFNRLKICMLKRWDIQREIELAQNCPGAGNCKCGRHILQVNNPRMDEADSISSISAGETSPDEKATKKDLNLREENSETQVVQEDLSCGSACRCVPEPSENERRIERNILESSKLQEQSGDMDTNLMPAEKYKQ
ncbi:high-affinity Cu transporter CTR1 NDAI_0A04640 [Naumovozyma dairenensis CBS 421]|uniref:Copper transport protein n=1 Tax=Naumovozyma dairenensis (strain ATCC 10597 / BCRC 20456 / CBS 421 / NBRC 0211 / NRRL Y-12639) TaxID=1071378 RepID=G0W482_NAUDC|nr:hypothetical protein NDAI_0A04640 [Naumovozyma dairenensis CBS 421]CCD22620.1 hypothetical protein NDAI_0A04640 [Naumovozyma dairenensis CBS 421]